MKDDDATRGELLALTERLLESIAQADWETYAELCDPDLTAFEPEARGSLVHGMDFHRFYFERGSGSTPQNTTICSPHVWLFGDTAVVSYVRLLQHIDASGAPTTSRFEETRVWHRRDGAWRHVHFHRSAN